jgi:hypothetical protein
MPFLRMSINHSAREHQVPSTINHQLGMYSAHNVPVTPQTSPLHPGHQTGKKMPTAGTFHPVESLRGILLFFWSLQNAERSLLCVFLFRGGLFFQWDFSCCLFFLFLASLESGNYYAHLVIAKGGGSFFIRVFTVIQIYGIGRSALCRGDTYCHVANG